MILQLFFNLGDSVKAQLAKYGKRYDGWEGKKILVQKTNKQKTQTPKWHRKPAGTDCLRSLSTPHEWKQSSRKQVCATFLPPPNYSLHSAQLSCRTTCHIMLEYYNWIHGLPWKLNKLMQKSIKGLDTHKPGLPLGDSELQAVRS